MTILALGTAEGNMRIQAPEVFEDVLEGAGDRLVEGAVALAL
ncbi:hypothetical protein [Methylobacterium sp. J-072]